MIEGKENGRELCGEEAARFFARFVRMERPCFYTPSRFASINWLYATLEKMECIEVAPAWLRERLETYREEKIADDTLTGTTQEIIFLGGGLVTVPFRGSIEFMKGQGTDRVAVLHGRKPRLFFIVAWDSKTKEEIPFPV